MSEVKQEVKPLLKLLEMNNLTIPEYQRPYKWKAENVTQLLDDIFEYVITKEKTYRIGSLIVHEESTKLNIVDGQQRLTTISILLHHLNHGNSLLLNQNYKHIVSKDNIVYNSRIIKNWLESKISDKESFKNKICEKCEFVIFTVYRQDEAFQLFDSQNSRGKSLEPHDLLKAFHLREMEHEEEKDRLYAVQCWERAIEDKTLKPILGNHLFKIRKWVRNEWKYDFTKDDIDEFKGISLHREQKYLHETALRMLDGLVENAQNNKLLKNNHILQSFPFSITMPIINGKRFFEYVEHYIQLRKSIFETNEDPSFMDFYRIYCLGEKWILLEENNEEDRIGYHGAGRTGDWKVRNLYENTLLLYKDRFGEFEFEKFYKAFYKLIYSIRCNNKSIRFETILNSNNEHKLLQEIRDSINPEILKRYQYYDYKITETDMVNGAEFIKNSINNNFNHG